MQYIFSSPKTLVVSLPLVKSFFEIMARKRNADCWQRKKRERDSHNKLTTIQYVEVEPVKNKTAHFHERSDAWMQRCQKLHSNSYIQSVNGQRQISFMFSSSSRVEGVLSMSSSTANYPILLYAQKWRVRFIIGNPCTYKTYPLWSNPSHPPFSNYVSILIGNV